MTTAFRVLVTLVAILSYTYAQQSPANNNEDDTKQSTISSDDPTRCDVAIIGGGAAGANAAVFVKDKFPGKRVCIFERFSELGGHCDTIPFVPPAGCRFFFTPPLANDSLCPNWLDVGVQIYGNTTWFKANGKGIWTIPGGTDGHMARFLPYGKNSLIAVPVFFDAGFVTYTVDLTNKQPTAVLSPAHNDTAVGAAVTRWITEFSTKYPWLDDAGNYPDRIPEELTVDFATYIKLPENSWMTPLVFPIFYPLLGIGGLGNWSELPTIYALLNLHPGLMQWYFFPNPGALSVVGGCQKFYNGIATYLTGLGDQIFYAANISKITREKNYGDDDDDKRSKPTYTISASIGTGAPIKNYTAKKIFLAIPPTTRNLNAIGMNFLPKKLREVFDSVKTRNYFAIWSELTGGITENPRYNVFNFNYLGLGNATTPATPYPGTPAYINIGRQIGYGPAVGYSGGNGTNLITPPEMRAILTAQFAELVAANPALLTSIPITGLIPHTYQPHYPAEILREKKSPYKIVAEFQGKNGLFYVGALHTYCESAKIMEHAYRIVTKKLDFDD